MNKEPYKITTMPQRVFYIISFCKTCIPLLNSKEKTLNWHDNRQHCTLSSKCSRPHCSSEGLYDISKTNEVSLMLDNVCSFAGVSNLNLSIWLLNVYERDTYSHLQRYISQLIAMSVFGEILFNFNVSCVWVFLKLL